MNDRPPATEYRLAKLRRAGRMLMPVTEIASDGSLVVNLVGESHVPSLTFFCLERARPGDRLDGRTSLPDHKRKPPRKALAFWPARHRRGSALSFLTLPPPITVSSGRRAALSRSTTSAT